MGRTPSPSAARSAAGTALAPAPAPDAPPGDGSPAAAVLAALSAGPPGATVTVVAARAGISAAAARQALLAHEKAGTATRVKGSRPGVADTWHPAAAQAGPGTRAPATEAPSTGSAAGSAGAGEGPAVAAPGPDPAVTAEAARRRVLKVAASGLRGPATRPGALRELVEEHLRKFPETAFTPHQVGKVLTRSAGAVANALDKLTGLGVEQLVTDKPRAYRLAPAAAPAPAAAGASPVAARRRRPAPRNARPAQAARPGRH